MSAIEIQLEELAPRILSGLRQGAFFTTQSKTLPNTMTIGWGTIGRAWAKPIFTAWIRHSRYSRSLVDTTKEFTVSIPLTHEFCQALEICGRLSGRNENKFSAAGLVPIPSRKVSPPIIAGNCIHLECRVIGRQLMPSDTPSPEIRKTFYPEEDFHILYHGEILAVYVTE